MLHPAELERIRARKANATAYTAPPPHCCPQNSMDHLDKIDNLEEVLKSIRFQLQPIIKQVNTMPFESGPHAELMELAAGRLLKVHSENLIELVIDDVLEETVHLLNGFEELEKRRKKERSMKEMMVGLIEGVGSMDVMQRHHYQTGLEFKTFKPLPKQEVGGEFVVDTRSLLANIENFEYLTEGEEKVKVDIDSYLLMKIVRDQIMHKYKLEE